MAMILNLKKYNVRYKGQDEYVLKDIELCMQSGKCLGIIGNNGCGKSTFASSIIGIIPKLQPGEIIGDAYFNNQDLIKLDLNNRLDLIGYSFQDTESQVLFGTVADILGLNEKDSPVNFIKKAAKILQVDTLLDRTPDQLSGGEIQKVSLITALRKHPKLVLFDEATTALDPNVRIEFGKLVNYLSDNGISVILFGQREALILPYTNNFLYLRNGSFSSSKNKYDNNTLNDKASKFWSEICIGLKINKAEKFKISNLKFSRSTTNFNFGPINFSCEGGETIALVGPNGSGKTTFLQLLMGFLKSTNGEITIGNKLNLFKNIKSTQLPFMMVSQSPLAQIIGETIEEEIVGLLKTDNSKKYNLKKLEEILLDHFSFIDLSKDPLQLSYGQQRLLTILTVILSHYPIIFIEEPEQGLDFISLHYIKTWLQINRKKHLKTVLFTTHDLDLAYEVSDRCILISEGQFIKEDLTKNINNIHDWYFSTFRVNNDK